MTGHRLEDEDGIAKQVKFLGYVFAALILVLVIHTVYVSQAAPPKNRPNSPANLEAARTPRGFVYSLVDASVEGQVVYVPAYSHVYQGAGDPYLLTITLSVRNTSISEEIVVDSIRYFDTNGVKIRSYLDNRRVALDDARDRAHHRGRDGRDDFAAGPRLRQAGRRDLRQEGFPCQGTRGGPRRRAT